MVQVLLKLAFQIPEETQKRKPKWHVIRALQEHFNVVLHVGLHALWLRPLRSRAPLGTDSPGGLWGGTRELGTRRASPCIPLCLLNVAMRLYTPLFKKKKKKEVLCISYSCYQLNRLTFHWHMVSNVSLAGPFFPLSFWGLVSSLQHHRMPTHYTPFAKFFCKTTFLTNSGMNGKLHKS